MTEQEAIELATKYQKERNRSVKISLVHRVPQEKIDALAEWSRESGITEQPEWLKLVPHWVVLFDRELNMVPKNFVISVCDDGSVSETPSM
jgi:hypothetical protein